MHSMGFPSRQIEASDVQKRVIVRWANTARTKAASSSDAAKRAAYEICTKKLQVMDPNANAQPNPSDSISFLFGLASFEDMRPASRRKAENVSS